PSKKPSLHYRFSPKLQPVEYLCYLGGVLSLWFGFSVYDIFGWSAKLSRLFTMRAPSGFFSCEEATGQRKDVPLANSMIINKILSRLSNLERNTRIGSKRVRV